jgi:hypothetical protein
LSQYFFTEKFDGNREIDNAFLFCYIEFSRIFVFPLGIKTPAQAGMRMKRRFEWISMQLLRE